MLWQPTEDRVVKTRMYHFIRQTDKKFPLADFTYAALYKFSIHHPQNFWRSVIEYFGVKYYGELEPVNLDSGFDSYGWFPNLSLNFAENLLLYGEDYKVAIKSLFENGEKKEISFGQLKSLVARLQGELKPIVGKGDVVACYLPNVSEAVIAMLATSGLGGIFTSTSAGLSVDGVIERFSQSKPKVLVACAGYEYNGKYFNMLENVAELVARLGTLEKVIIVDCLNKQPDIAGIDSAIHWEQAINNDFAELHFVPSRFSDPLYIMYSEGATAKPECSVHSVGGVLVQHIKELGLHADHNAGKNIFFDTTCGWAVWNWLVSALYFGGTVTLYAGSPAYPSYAKFLERLSNEEVNILGTSATYLNALQASGTNVKSIGFDALESILCTGPLLPQQYDYVYQYIKSDVMLAGISAGANADIVAGCLFLGNPMAPVYRGELQCRGLGMDVACVDEFGEQTEASGELVCRQSFPSRPIYLLDDEGGEKIRSVYFERFKNVWSLGDYVQMTESGGGIMLGPRSDMYGAREIYQ